MLPWNAQMKMGVLCLVSRVQEADGRWNAGVLCRGCHSPMAYLDFCERGCRYAKSMEYSVDTGLVSHCLELQASI
jgi:hypothetical protein